MFDWLRSLYDLVSNFFSSFFNAVASVVDYVKSLFHVIGSALRFVVNCVSYLPSVYVAFVSIILVVCVVYLVVGRSTGGD